MTYYREETIRSAIDAWQEYQDYLARFAVSAINPRPLSFSEFQTALERWQRDYHTAWSANDTATMRELERLLAL